MQIYQAGIDGTKQKESNVNLDMNFQFNLSHFLKASSTYSINSLGEFCSLLCPMCPCSWPHWATPTLKRQHSVNIVTDWCMSLTNISTGYKYELCTINVGPVPSFVGEGLQNWTCAEDQKDAQTQRRLPHSNGYMQITG